MSTPLLPQAFWFRLAVPCTRVDGLPRSGGPRLLDLPEACRLPETSRLDGVEPWASVRLAWNPGGLAVQVDAEGNLEALGADDRPEAVYGVNLWVDTRDTRDVSRATRFCHRFDVRLTKGKGPGKATLGVQVQPRSIARAVADAPLCRPEILSASAARVKNGWRLEIFLPAAALNGFDPETNRRLGFAYRVTDPERGEQFLAAGREFPVGENPSLWSTVELRDPS